MELKTTKCTLLYLSGAVFLTCGVGLALASSLITLPFTIGCLGLGGTLVGGGAYHLFND